VVKSLNERDLLPGVISGASAGSIIAAMLGTRTHDELHDVLNAEFIYNKFKDWRIFKGVRSNSLFDSRKLENALIELFDVMTFEEAFQRTGRHVTITVSPADLHQYSRLLNAKTSPNAIITQAVRASCAVPIVFSPVQLRAKTPEGEIVPYIPNRRFADGSLMADLPFDRLARLYGVNHSIVSQTNPLAVPFLSRNRKDTHTATSITMRHVTNLAKMNSIYAFDMLESAVSNRAAKLAIHKVRSIIDQQYVGDINILPERGVKSLAHLWSNPTVDSIAELIRNGEKATWPQLDYIERSTHISQTLRRYLKQLKEREARVLGNTQTLRLVESKSA
jgi:predicted acylesterase/phospholipase RssA